MDRGSGPPTAKWASQPPTPKWGSQPPTPKGCSQPPAKAATETAPATAPQAGAPRPMGAAWPMGAMPLPPPPFPPAPTQVGPMDTGHHSAMQLVTPQQMAAAHSQGFQTGGMQAGAYMLQTAIRELHNVLLPHAVQRASSSRGRRHERSRTPPSRRLRQHMMPPHSAAHGSASRYSPPRSPITPPELLPSASPHRAATAEHAEHTDSAAPAEEPQAR